MGRLKCLDADKWNNIPIIIRETLEDLAQVCIFNKSIRDELIEEVLELSDMDEYHYSINQENIDALLSLLKKRINSSHSQLEEEIATQAKAAAANTKQAKEEVL